MIGQIWTKGHGVPIPDVVEPFYGREAWRCELSYPTSNHESVTNPRLGSALRSLAAMVPLPILWDSQTTTLDLLCFILLPWWLMPMQETQ